MQLLNAAPRDGLTVAQVTALLTAPVVTVDFGCDLLAADLSFVQDISADLVGGKVERNMGADIHGTCSLQLARTLAWGVDLVRPWMTLTDPTAGTSARWNLGAFVLTTPRRVVGELPETFDVQGFDRIMLLTRQVGATYTVAAGTTYRAALVATFAAAGLTGLVIDGSAADNTLPTTQVWALVGQSTSPDQVTTPATWLRVVNDLLRAINFRAVWCDETGAYRCGAYLSPTTQPPAFTFDADDQARTIIGEQRTITSDAWAVPNLWLFRQTNRPTGSVTATEGDGLYSVVNQSDGPQSIDQRGLTWAAVVDYDAADQTKLVALGDRRVATDRRVSSVVQVTTGPFPGAGHADIYSYTDSAAGLNVKVQATRWQMPLDGGDMSYDWEVIR